MAAATGKTVFSILRKLMKDGKISKIELGRILTARSTNSSVRLFELLDQLVTDKKISEAQASILFEGT